MAMECKANECRSLDEVRANIDLIDKQIIRLIGVRGCYVDQAAHFKKNIEEVADKKRVEAVINKVKQIASEENIEPYIIEKIYRTMIGAFVEKEASQAISVYRQIKESYY